MTPTTDPTVQEHDHSYRYVNNSVGDELHWHPDVYEECACGARRAYEPDDYEEDVR